MAPFLSAPRQMLTQMKLLATTFLGVVLITGACKKDSDKNEGELPMTIPQPTFRGLKATVNGTAIDATASSIRVRRRAGDPGIGALPALQITGEFEKKSLDVEINWDEGTQPKAGTYLLTFNTDKMHYYSRVYYDDDIDAPSSSNTYYGSSSADTDEQKGKIIVSVVDDHHFVGAFSAIVKNPISGVKKEVINGQFGGEY
jgi:hypothetical protein